jgi:hypothetical protein
LLSGVAVVAARDGRYVAVPSGLAVTLVVKASMCALALGALIWAFAAAIGVSASQRVWPARAGPQALGGESVFRRSPNERWVSDEPT